MRLALGYPAPLPNEFTAIIHKDDDSRYGATCPEVPGPNGQGLALDEVREDLAAAIELMLEVMRDDALAESGGHAIRDVVSVD